MDESNVTFKGTVNGLTIIMKEEETFEEIIEQIEQKVLTAGKFFKGAVLNVKYKGRKLTREEEEKIFLLLTKKSGAKIRSIIEENDDSKSKIQKSKTPVEKMKMKTVFFTGIEEGSTKFYRGTARSGTLINFSGNVVVMGDVNPGAEIVAAGNVVVMGSLRGIVHAGADGNKEAFVSALYLSPTQLRIADVITRSPDEDGSKVQMVPEIAYIKDEQVFIERFLPNR